MNAQANASATEAPAAHRQDINKVFSKNATYTVAEDAHPVDLLQDASLWLDTSQNSLALVLLGLEEGDGGAAAFNLHVVCGALHGILHSLEMAEGIIDLSTRKVMAMKDASA